MNKKLLKILITVLVILAGICGTVIDQPAQIPDTPPAASVIQTEALSTEALPTEATGPSQTSPKDESESLPDISGQYDSLRDVALFIHLFGRLPDNYLTKSEARALGWDGGSVERYAPGCCIGGDTFRNSEGLLPDAPGRKWTECDIDTLGKSSRGAKRIVFSNDGLIYYTEDHYETFELIYGEP